VASFIPNSADTSQIEGEEIIDHVQAMLNTIHTPILDKELNLNISSIQMGSSPIKGGSSILLQSPSELQFAIAPSQ
jgi:hypothetical protein